MNIPAFILYCIIVTSTPGPTNILILSTASNSGIKKAIRFSYGALLGCFVLLMISLILNSVLITILPKIVAIMKILGSIYILYLAYQIYKMDSSESNISNCGSFKTGFFMQFINPKVVLFTMTIIPSFIMPYYSSVFEQILFVLLITFICIIAFGSWVIFGKLLKSFLQKHQRKANIIMSLFLAYSAIMVSGITEYI